MKMQGDDHSMSVFTIKPQFEFVKPYNEIMLMVIDAACALQTSETLICAIDFSKHVCFTRNTPLTFHASTSCSIDFSVHSQNHQSTCEIWIRMPAPSNYAGTIYERRIRSITSDRMSTRHENMPQGYAG
jgi:hypothetical protein